MQKPLTRVMKKLVKIKTSATPLKAPLDLVRERIDIEVVGRFVAVARVAT